MSYVTITRGITVALYHQEFTSAAKPARSNHTVHSHSVLSPCNTHTPCAGPRICISTQHQSRTLAFRNQSPIQPGCASPGVPRIVRVARAPECGPGGCVCPCGYRNIATEVTRVHSSGGAALPPQRNTPTTPQSSRHTGTASTASHIRSPPQHACLIPCMLHTRAGLATVTSLLRTMHAASCSLPPHTLPHSR